MKISVAAVAKITGGKIHGRKTFIIKNILPPEAAKKNDMTFLFNINTLTRASVIVTDRPIRGRISIVVENPKAALFKLLKSLSKASSRNFIASSALIENGVKLPKAFSIDHGAIMKKGARIGIYTKIGANCYIDNNVKIGAHCQIYPNSIIFSDTVIGDHVAIGAGTVIGSPGFGFVRRKHYCRYHHIGSVKINDYVEIGANCTIDRATLGKTIIGAGTKIDNLVHIAHNVRIGKNCLIMGQCGIAGSACLGNEVILCGQVGISDHVAIGDGSIVYAKSAVFKSIPKNLKFSGIPAREHESVLRALARLYREH